MVYLAVALSAALGGFVQSITGFGAAVVMMTILPYFFTMAVAPSVSTSICLGLTVTLAWKLRNDERVVCMEKTNIRYVTPNDIDDELDFASVDVSFISLTKVLGPARALLKDGGEMVCLIKPQFEAGREKVGKKGVVRDKSVHEEVVNNIISFALSNGFSVLDLEYSPIKGPEGNIEYLVHIKKTDDPIKEESVDIHSVVEAAHGELDRK